MTIELPEALAEQVYAASAAQATDPAAYALAAIAASTARDLVSAPAELEDDVTVQRGLDGLASGHFEPEEDEAQELLSRYGLPRG